MKTYRVKVTETYETFYDIQAEDGEDATTRAEEIAQDDGEIVSPENMVDRDVLVIDIQDDGEECR